MTIERTYFDFNATAPLCDEARDAVLDAMENLGNASSVHGEGRRAHARVEEARAAVAALVGVVPDCVTFTSGGTEANHLAFAQAAPRAASAILYSKIEHPSVVEAAEKAGAEAGIPTFEIPVAPTGVLDLHVLETLLIKSGDKPFVSVMAANNETGVIQPIEEIAELVRNTNGMFHVDAIQMAGKLNFDMRGLGIDMATLSAHKIGGPQGVGAFVLAHDASVTPRQTGGGQERGRRSGTENVAGIAGFGAAARAALAELKSEDETAVRRLRDLLETRLIECGLEVSVFGSSVPRLPNTSCFSAPGLKAETLLMQLDLAGFAVSAGSACSSGKVAQSHVLRAMSIDEDLAAGAVRVSLGQTNTEIEIDRFADVWIKAAQRTKCVAERTPPLLVAEG